MMTKLPEVQTFAMEERDRLPVGRASIGLFDDYKVVGGGAIYDGLTLRGDEAISEPSFMARVDQRWTKIKEDDAKQDAEHQPKMYRPSPYEVGFKYKYDEIDLKGYEGSYYYGEGAVWRDNKALFIAPGGDIDADKVIPKIITNIRKTESKNDKGFCLQFYCLDLPPSKYESADITVNFPAVKGLMLSSTVETYTSEQREYYSKRTPIGDIPAGYDLLGRLSGTIYAKPSMRQVDGLNGEQDIAGASEKISENEYNNYIEARWYYPGTSNDPHDPAIEINLVYEVRLDHKPSTAGWFDDETVKQTGFTPEKFMSMWEATLKSFKRNR